MWKDNFLAQKLQITYPLIQAPMAGGPTTPELIAAVSNSGGLGSLGGGYMAPEKIREAIGAIRNLTNQPFAVNLFVPEDAEEDPSKIKKMAEVLSPLREELSIPNPPPLAKSVASFEEQMAVVLEEKVPVLSFTFGMLSEAWVSQLKSAQITLIGTATHVEEAIALEKQGIDIVVAQGSEAGGHRGAFLLKEEESLIGTIALVPQMVDCVNIPVIAAGGIMDGRGIVAALVLGASGVQLGTAFLTCSESGTHRLHQQALLHHTEEATQLTRMYSGKLARGVKNQFMAKMQIHETDVPDYPLQNALTQDIRTASAQQGKPEYMAMWSGQGIRLSRSTSANDLMQNLLGETEKILHHMS